MNTLRSARAEGGHDPLGFASDDEETGYEPPPHAIGAAERRLQVRAYNCWASLLGEQPIPAIADLTPARLAQFGPHAVLLDFTGGHADPAIDHIGAALAEECGHAGPIRRLSEVPPGSLLARITEEYAQVLASQAPAGFEAEFVNAQGATILYRGILLPFSSDQVAIDHVLGVINWKELADAQVAGELELQISRTLDAVPALDRLQPEPAMPVDWADGPEPLRDRREVAAELLPWPEDLAIEAAFPAPEDASGFDAALARRLRLLDGTSVDAVGGEGEEFGLLLVRRRLDGEVVVLGEVQDEALLARAARQLLD
jgi:hypothetical protein